MAAFPPDIKIPKDIGRWVEDESINSDGVTVVFGTHYIVTVSDGTASPDLLFKKKTKPKVDPPTRRYSRSKWPVSK